MERYFVAILLACLALPASAQSGWLEDKYDSLGHLLCDYPVPMGYYDQPDNTTAPVLIFDGSANRSNNKTEVQENKPESIGNDVKAPEVPTRKFSTNQLLGAIAKKYGKDNKLEISYDLLDSIDETHTRAIQHGDALHISHETDVEFMLSESDRMREKALALRDKDKPKLAEKVKATNGKR